MAADLDDWSVLEEESSSSLSPPLPPPRSLSNQPEFWMRVEEATREIIEQVHPTLVSEDRRRDVIQFVQGLIRMTLGFEVKIVLNVLCCVARHWLLSLFALTFGNQLRRALNVGTCLNR